MSSTKKEFEMTDEELARIKEISQRPATPVMKIGDVVTGDDKHEDAYSFWRDLGVKYEFIWDTAEAIPGKGGKFFRAIPISQS